MTIPYDELLDYAQSSDDGMDSDASIQPIGIEDIAPEVQNRPLQHLRRRTERLRAAVELLRYYVDYGDLVPRCDAAFTLAYDAGTTSYLLSMVAGTEDDLVLWPLLTPGVRSGGRARGGVVYVGDLPYSGVLLVNDVAFTAHGDYTGQRGYADGTTFAGGGGNPALTLGANGIRLHLVADPAVATGVITSTITGAPARVITLTYGTLGGSTTIAQLITYVNTAVNLFTGETYGPSVFLRASKDPATPGGAAPTPFTDGRVRGAYDAEAHRVTIAQLAAFFGAVPGANWLQEGEGLALAYEVGAVETGVVPTGGRRQSVLDLPTDRVGANVDNTTPGVGYSLFNTGREPQKIPGSVPVGKLVNGEFVFLDGTRVGVGAEARLGESTALWARLADQGVGTDGADLVGYEGSGAWHVDAAASANPAVPAGTVHDALTAIVADLARMTANQSGIRRIGAEKSTATYTTGNGAHALEFASDESLRERLEGLQNATYGINQRVSEDGHALKGVLPLSKDFATEAVGGGGELVVGTAATLGDVALAPNADPQDVLTFLQPIEWDVVTATDMLLAAEPCDHAGAGAAQLHMTHATAGARMDKWKERLPLGVTTTPGVGGAVLLYPVMVTVTGVDPGTSVDGDGRYYLSALTTAQRLVTLVKRDGTSPSFVGATFAGGAHVTFNHVVTLGSDVSGQRLRAFHGGSAAFASLAFAQPTVALLELFACYTTAAFLRLRLTPQKFVFYDVDGVTPTRDSDDILAHNDKLLLDGVESGAPVDATANHHHGATYTKTVMEASASVTELTCALNVLPTGATAATSPIAVPTGYRRVAAILQVIVELVTDGLTVLGDRVRFTYAFTGCGTSFEELLVPGAAVYTVARTCQMVVPVAHATLKIGFTPNVLGALFVDAAASSMTVNQVGSVYERIP